MKQLIKHGDSLALVIDKPILDLLKIDADTPLEVSIDGDHLIVRPYRGESKCASVKDALEWVNSRYDDALQRLAE